MQIHPAIRELLNEIESFQDRTGLSSNAVGTRSINDPGLVSDLREGRTPTIKTIDRIRAFMTQAESRSPRQPETQQSK